MNYIYISGLITDINGHIDSSQYAMFDAIASKLRYKGYVVVNPAEIAKNNHLNGWNSYDNIHIHKRACIQQLATCDTVYLLIGSSKCEMSKFEQLVAKELNINIIHHTDGLL